MGYVYIKTSKTDRQSELFKIGKWTKDFHTLYKRYGTSTPNLEIVLCLWFDQEGHVEKMVHKDLAKYKIEGQGQEHFRCPLTVAVDAVLKYYQRSMKTQSVPDPTLKRVEQDVRLYNCLVNCPNSFYSLIKTENMFIDLNMIDAICITHNIDLPLFRQRRLEQGWINPLHIYNCQIAPYGVRPNTCFGFPANIFYAKMGIEKSKYDEDNLSIDDIRKTIEYTSKKYGHLRFEGFDGRCIGITKKGTRCKLDPLSGSQFCKWH